MPTTDIIRGGADVPLSNAGRMVACERAIQFARKGGIDYIVSSSLDRAVETAHIVQKANPKASYKEIVGSLNTWYLGGLEGEDKTKATDKEIRDLVLNFPNRIPPEPTRDQKDAGIPQGESFNAFRRRVFAWVGPAIQRYLMMPDKKVLWVIHHRVIRLMEAWARGGFKPDFSIDIREVVSASPHDEPGQVEHLWPTSIRKEDKGQWADWHLKHMDMESLARLTPGIYMLRHSFSLWNAGGGRTGVS